jgi:hypothetical protein
MNLEQARQQTTGSVSWRIYLGAHCRRAAHVVQGRATRTGASISFPEGAIFRSIIPSLGVFPELPAAN